MFEKGDRIRIDIPDETDPDHEKYHGTHGTITDILGDDAGQTTRDKRDNFIYRIELEDGSMVDVRHPDLRAPFD